MNYQKQVDTIEKMQADGYNVVTCGHCGSVILIDKSNPDVKEDDDIIICPHCKEESSNSDCPDFYYEGMPELDREKDEQ